MAKKKTAEKLTSQTTPPKQAVLFPKSVLAPIGVFFRQSLSQLEKRRKELKKEDPFSDVSRRDDNASPDADAEEQFGHAKTEAIRAQLERKVSQTKKALVKIKKGTYGTCDDCGKMIDTDRLTIYPEATICAKCQRKREK